jgi:hypothetical protein
MVTDFTILAVDGAGPHEIQNVRPGAALVFASQSHRLQTTCAFARPCALAISLESQLIILAVDRTGAHEIESVSPGAAIVLAFLFDAEEAWDDFLVILRHRDGVASQCVASVAEIGLRGGDQLVDAEVILLGRGGVGKASIAGEGNQVARSGGGGDPLPGQKLPQGLGLVSQLPAFEAKAVEELGPDRGGLVLAHARAHQRIFGDAGDNGQAIVQFCHHHEAEAALLRIGRSDASFDDDVFPSLS